MFEKPTVKLFAFFKRRLRIEAVFFVFLCLLSFFAYQGGDLHGERPFPLPRTPLERSDNSQYLVFQLNINEADESELTLLPRIGETLAKRIVEYRTVHGSFSSIDDLMQVKGIGSKTLARLRPYCQTDQSEKRQTEANQDASTPL